MSTDTSVPEPRVSGLEVSDSALLDTLLREAPIGFAFFGTDLRFRRVNRTLARLHGGRQEDYLGHTPSEGWPAPPPPPPEPPLPPRPPPPHPPPAPPHPPPRA